MNPSDSNQTSDTPPETWFSTLPNPDMPGVDPTPRPSHKRKIILIITTIAVLVGVAVSTIVILTPSSVGSCLTNEDYKLLTGKSVDPQLSVTSSFYTASFTYTNGTSQYADSTKTEGPAVVEKIGNFYKQRSAGSSLIITISGDYTSDDTKTAASERIAKLKAALIQSGAKESNIKTNAPTEITSDNELEENSKEFTSATTYVNLSSDTACR